MHIATDEEAAGLLSGVLPGAGDAAMGGLVIGTVVSDVVVAGTLGSGEGGLAGVVPGSDMGSGMSATGRSQVAVKTTP